MNNKRNKNKQLPKFANGTWNFASTAKDGLTQANFAGGANLAGGVFDIVDNLSPDQSSAGSYVGKIGSNAAKFAGMGAALGPWGAVAGGVIGAGAGVYEAVTGDQANQNRIRTEKINTNAARIMDMSNVVQSKYDLRNPNNYQVPGMDKGSANFKGANALVAKEEGIKDPNTGRVMTVPGKYNPNNPDTVPVNLPDGSSIYSANPKYKIPGGKSTPADIVAKLEKMQNNNDKILSGKRPSGLLDKKTAELNKKNIDKQTELLNMNTMIQQYMKGAAQGQSSLPKYDEGVAFTVGGKTYYNTNPKSGMYKANPLYYKDKNGQELYIPKADADELRNSIPQEYNTGFKNNVLGRVTVDSKGNPTGMVERTAPNVNGITETATKSVEAPMVPGYSSNVMGNAATNIANTPATGTTVGPASVKLVTPEKTISNTKENRMSELYKDPLLVGKSTDAIKNNVVNGPILAKSSAAPAGADTEDVVDNGGSLMDKLSSIGNGLMSLAPIAFNAANATPEVVRPRFNSVINPIERADISVPLAEAKKQRVISRFNQSATNTGTGASMAYGADLYSRGAEQTANILDSAQKANAGYRNTYADVANRNSEINTNELKRVDDLNSRNRAAARGYLAKNAEMISQYGQVNELMKNQKNSDLLNSNVWAQFASAVDPEVKMTLAKQMARTLGVPVSEIYKMKTKKPVSKTDQYLSEVAA